MTKEELKIGDKVLYDLYSSGNKPECVITHMDGSTIVVADVTDNGAKAMTNIKKVTLI